MQTPLPPTDPNVPAANPAPRPYLVPALAVGGAIVVGLLAWLGYAAWYPSPEPENAPIAAPEETEKPTIIGLSFDDFRESRWRYERDIIIAEAERMGGTVVVAVADGDADRQEAQAKNLIFQGAQALIVVATDSEKSAAIVEEAHRHGVKVIAYDRMIKNADLDYYVSFDSVRVGELEAQGVLDAAGGKGDFAYIGGSPTDNNAFLLHEGSFKVLQPKIDAGDVRIVLDKYVDNWEANKAFEIMDGFLKGGGKVDGVIVANDGMASGVIQALRDHGLAGKVPVSGQDAELLACRNIVAGVQTLTVYKPLRKLAEEATAMAMAAARQRVVQTSSTVPNGKTDVPSRLLDVVMVTKDNLEETVIKDGLYTREEVFGTQR